jgi:hemoglobin-like flavoprotein
MIQMIDTAMNLLGPDIELLTEIMLELGQKHVRYGVKPEMFPIMESCLIDTMSDILGDSFTSSMVDSWKETYRGLSSDMLQAQLKTITGTPSVFGSNNDSSNIRQ